MKKNKIYFIGLILCALILIVFIMKELWRLNINNSENKTEVISKITKSNFKNRLLEDVVTDLKTFTKEKNVEISDISMVKYDNKTYLKILIPEIENSNYLIHYEGMNITTLHADIWNVNKDNVDTIFKIIVSLIEVSDKNINEVEAIQIYSELLTGLEKNKSIAQLKLKNGLIYILESTETNAIVFTIK